MKKHFFTGLALLLPILITLFFAYFFINLLTKPFLGVTESALTYMGLKLSHQWLQFISRIFILVFLVISTLIIGFFGKLFLTRAAFQVADRLIHKIPFVNKIYKALQDVVHTLFESKQSEFTQVVLVPFPNKDSSSLGLITNECLPEGTDREHGGYLSVFVPGTPNPTMGFMILFKRETVTFVDLKVEDALRIIISCGVMAKTINNKT